MWHSYGEGFHAGHWHQNFAISVNSASITGCVFHAPEDSPSGLWRTLGKRVGCKPSGVRIPHPPQYVPGIR